MNSRQLHSSEAGSANIATFMTVFSAVFLLIVITATLITFILPETFAGTARLKLEIETVKTNQPVSNTQTELDVIQSEAVLGPVIQSLRLNEEWGKKYAGGEPLKSWETLEFLKKSLHIKPVQNTTLVEVIAFSDRPDEAAKIANSVAESYRSFAIKTTSEPENPATARIRPIIIDRAIASQEPVRPKKALNITLGCVLGIVFGAIAGTLVVALRKAFAKK
jgi:uncharacterized protein involved in exopolysaccharide biosynthesis